MTLPAPAGTEPQPSSPPRERHAVLPTAGRPACGSRRGHPLPERLPRPQNGGFSDHPEAKPDAISTAVGLMILGELKLPVEPYVEAGLRFMSESTEGFEQVRMVATALEDLGRRVPKADAWLREIERAKTLTVPMARARGRDDGTPCRGGATAWGQAAHGRRGAEGSARRPAADGGFGGDEEGGYGRRPNEPSSLHGTYYATIVRHWLTVESSPAIATAITPAPAHSLAPVGCHPPPLSVYCRCSWAHTVSHTVRWVALEDLL